MRHGEQTDVDRDRLPTISVCIPVFEPDVAFLDELLRSIAGQTVAPHEVVVVDDASRVDIAPTLEAWADVIPLRTDANRVNLGMVANWNEVVARSTGDLVMLVCQDDVLGASMLEEYRQEFVDGPDVVLCGGAEVFVDAAGEVIGRRTAVTQRSRIYRARERYDLEAHDLVRLCLRNGQAFGEPSAVMFRRSVFDQVGGYRERYVHASDIDFNLRVAREGHAAYVNRPHLHRRIHAGNLTWGHIASGATSRDRVQLHLDYVDELDGVGRERARVTLVSFAVRDLIRAARAHRWEVVRQNVEVVWRFKRNRPRRYIEHLWEIWTRSNLDER